MIRILLVDDQAIIREALKVLLEQEQDFEIVGTADSGQKAIALVEAIHPDIALIDIIMPGMDGIEATQIICKRFPTTRVIVLSGQDDERSLASALQAGARGYLVKNTAAEDLSSTIRAVHRGHSQLGPGLFEKMVAGMTAPVAPPLPEPVVSEPVVPQAAAVALPDLSVIGLSEPEWLSLLQRFDPEELPKVAQRAIACQATSSLLIRLGYYLKDHPTNLTALYLSGTLLHRGQNREKTGFQYLKFGFKAGLKQKLSREELFLFYQEASLIQPEAAFSWLTHVDSPWSHGNKLTLVINEAERLFGSDSHQYRALVILRYIRGMHLLNEACNSLRVRLGQLQSGFDQQSYGLKQLLSPK